MKKIVSYVFIALAAIIIMISLKMISGYFFANMQTQGLTQIGPKIDVLVIDIPNQSQEQLLQRLEDGNAQLLLWIEHKDGDMQAYAFNTLESLVRLEQNNLGFLETNDSDLKNLNIAQYDKEKKIFYFTPLKNTDISVIEASRNYLIGEVLSDPKNYQTQAGVVVLSNDTKKELRMVKIPESQIQDAKFLRDKTKRENNEYKQ